MNSASSKADAAAGQVFITRVVNAPRERVFAAWSDAASLGRWYAPSGCTLKVCEVDFSEGGSFRQCIETPSGYACWCKGEYREISAPERIVFTMMSTDAQGNRVEPAVLGMDPEWPGETLVRVTFEALGENQTRLTLHQTAPEAIAKRTGAYAGWLSMLERLEQELAPA